MTYPARPQQGAPDPFADVPTIGGGDEPGAGSGRAAAIADPFDDVAVLPGPAAPPQAAIVPQQAPTVPPQPSIGPPPGAADSAAAFGQGMAGEFLTAPFSMARGAIGTVFGNPSQEELDNPLVRASIVARMGRMPDVAPRPAGAPGPALEAAEQLRGLVTMPYDAAKAVADNPEMGMQERGARAADVVMGGAGVLHGAAELRSGIKEGRAARQTTSDLERIDPTAWGIFDDVRILPGEAPKGPPARAGAPPAPEPARGPTPTPPPAARQDEIDRIAARIEELAPRAGKDLLGDTAHEVEQLRRYLGDLEAGRGQEAEALDRQTVTPPANSGEKQEPAPKSEAPAAVTEPPVATVARETPPAAAAPSIEELRAERDQVHQGLADPARTDRKELANRLAQLDRAIGAHVRQEREPSPAPADQAPERLHPTEPAALKIGGKLYTGRDHFTAIQKALDDGVPEHMAEEARPGFVTDRGRFVNDHEGFDLARQAGQLRTDLEPSIDPADDQPYLDSADLQQNAGGAKYPPGPRDTRTDDQVRARIGELDAITRKDPGQNLPNRRELDTEIHELHEELNRRAHEVADRAGIPRSNIDDQDAARVALTHAHGSDRAAWARLKGEGATDAEILEQVGRQFGIQGGYAGGAIHYEYHGGKNPRLEIKGEGARLLKGKALAAEARRVFGIPEKGKGGPPAAPAGPPSVLRQEHVSAEDLADLTPREREYAELDDLVDAGEATDAQIKRHEQLGAELEAEAPEPPVTPARVKETPAHKVNPESRYADDDNPAALWEGSAEDLRQYTAHRDATRALLDRGRTEKGRPYNAKERRELEGTLQDLEMKRAGVEEEMRQAFGEDRVDELLGEKAAPAPAPVGGKLREGTLARITALEAKQKRIGKLNPTDRKLLKALRYDLAQLDAARSPTPEVTGEISEPIEPPAPPAKKVTTKQERKASREQGRVARAAAASTEDLLTKYAELTHRIQQSQGGHGYARTNDYGETHVGAVGDARGADDQAAAEIILRELKTRGIGDDDLVVAYHRYVDQLPATPESIEEERQAELRRQAEESRERGGITSEQGATDFDPSTFASEGIPRRRGGMGPVERAVRGNAPAESNEMLELEARLAGIRRQREPAELTQAEKDEYNDLANRLEGLRQQAERRHREPREGVDRGAVSFKLREPHASEGIPQGKGRPRDLFGNEERDTSPEQGSMFGEKAGTEASRSTTEQTRALAAERDKLRVLIRGKLKDSPSANARLAELDRLLNRDQKIGADEMSTRARAEERPRDPDEWVFQKAAESKGVDRGYAHKTIPGDVVTWRGRWRGKDLELRSTMRKADSSRDQFTTSSNERIRGEAGGKGRDVVDLEVTRGELTERELQDLADYAQRFDERPVRIRKRGERLDEGRNAGDAPRELEPGDLGEPPAPSGPQGSFFSEGIPQGKPFALRGDPSHISTVDAVRFAKEYLGAEEFRRRVREEANLGRGKRPPREPAALEVESTARRVVREAQDQPRAMRAPEEEAEEEPAAEPEVKPPEAKPVGPIKDALLRLLAPASRSGGGIEEGRIVRHRAGELAAEMERARERLADARKTVARMKSADRLRFIDDIEAGRPIGGKLGDAAAAMRQALDQARDEVRALGTGKLEHFYRDYFPHIWKDPKSARDVILKIMGKRPLEGPRSFLKKRSLVTVGEGIQHGLELATENPADLVLLKLREMRRYIMGQRILADMKREGLAKFVPAMSRAPGGYARIDDHIAMVFGPPDIPVMESFDPKLREGLEKVLAALGGTHTRSAKLPRLPRLGEASGGLGEAGKGGHIATRFATDVTVLEHELGHIIDNKIGLWDRLVEPPGQESHTVTRGKRKGQTIKRTVQQERALVEHRKTIREELRQLADLRFEGHEEGVTPHYKDYVREKPEQMANAIHAIVYAPERMQEVAPTVKAKLTEILKSDPRTAPLLRLEKSLVAGTDVARFPVGGLVVKGQFWAPEPAAKVLHNYLAPGLRGNPLYDAYMGAGNALNQAQLGMSAFHLGFTSVDAATSKLALSVEQLASGHPLKAAASAAQVPIAPLTTIWQGAKLRRAYLRPGSEGAEFDAIADALVQAGGRVRQPIEFTNNSVAAFMDALRERRPGGMLRHALGAAIELQAKPILEVIVPRQKLGVFADLARFELQKLERGGKAAPADVRAVMAKAWDSVDNRMGQLVYDNLFWSRTLKDLAMASTRSVGWNLGTIRELGGGGLDLAHGRLSHRAAYVLALPVTVGLAGAVMTYLYTGHGPRALVDYFLPPTGRVNEDGNEERVQLPSYVKDVIAYGRHPVQTVGHKLQPLLASLADMLQNRDYYGDRIRNVDDPLVVQLTQEAEYLAKQWVPFGIRNTLQERQHGQSTATKVAPFVGVTPAPRELVRSPAQQRMAEILERQGHTERNPEEVVASDRRRKILEGVREGSIKWRALMDSTRAGALSYRQAEGIDTRGREIPMVVRYKQLSWQDAEDVYRRGTPEERQRWWPVLWQKRLDALTQLASTGRSGALDRLKQLVAREKLRGPIPAGLTAQERGELIAR